MKPKDTKEIIRHRARDLFNKKGYTSISMRDISDSLNISVGNLTYHYKRKEDLIKAIILEMHENYRPNNPPNNLEKLDDFFSRMQENFKKNAFYFWHYTQLSELSESIKNIQIYMLKEDQTLLRESFNILRDEKLLKEENYVDEYHNIIKNILIVSIYWIPNSKLLMEKTDIFEYKNHIWSMIYPLLTNKGKKIYTDKIIERP